MFRNNHIQLSFVFQSIFFPATPYCWLLLSEMRMCVVIRFSECRSRCVSQRERESTYSHEIDFIMKKKKSETIIIMIIIHVSLVKSNFSGLFLLEFNAKWNYIINDKYYTKEAIIIYLHPQISEVNLKIKEIKTFRFPILEHSCCGSSELSNQIHCTKFIMFITMYFRII